MRRTFVFWSKFSMLGYTLLRCVHFAIWLSRDVNGYSVVSAPVDLSFNGISVFFAVLSYALIVIVWSTLIDKIEGLRVTMSKEIRKFRIIMTILTAVVCPLIGILFIVQAAAIGGSIMNTVYNIVIGLWLITLATVQFIFSFRVIRAMKSTQSGRQLSDALKTFRRKNTFLFVSDGIAVTLVIVLLAFPFTGFRNKPWEYLGYQTIVRLLEWGIAVCLFGVYSRYISNYGLLQSLKLVFASKVSMDTTLATSRISRNGDRHSIHPSKTSVTDDAESVMATLEVAESVSHSDQERPEVSSVEEVKDETESGKEDKRDVSTADVSSRSPSNDSATDN
jgi:hypothetical protein